MLSPLFDEAAADKEVIKSLSNEIERLKKITMSKIIKSTDGKFYRVHSYEEVSQEDVALELAQAQAFANELEGLLPVATDNLSQEPANAPTDEPAVPAAAEPVAEAAAPSPEPVAEQPAVAADQPAPDAPAEQPPAPAPVTLQ